MPLGRLGCCSGTSLTDRFGNIDGRFATTVLGVARVAVPEVLVFLEATAVDWQTSVTPLRWIPVGRSDGPSHRRGAPAQHVAGGWLAAVSMKPIIASRS
jgi:hypothetical protein